MCVTNTGIYYRLVIIFHHYQDLIYQIHYISVNDTTASTTTTNNNINNNTNNVLGAFHKSQRSYRSNINCLRYSKVYILMAIQCYK